ncbi:gamma carbonic anhydrase family protein [Antarcticirhabdus aurantiaca]|uniref:Gamma carbonic anhydrase family protein n=1 Tax=Antarcticirhabdus aurantiaca TaxID=2606717 RepID=A0ACD4NSA5_9HYPH|nr:gamma carbonic anhydrase family protein [Antarcticirhabdus aurantiaca]WAJ29608.1 gamma carbonic anhydrase family protein [Jeongeuplla avenae]
MTIYALDGIAPRLPAGFCFVAPSAEVIGDVVLGEDVGIWFGAVLRGDNDLITIGARTNIQDMTMVHVDPGLPVTIGENCTIGHRAIVHGCTIGNNTLIGMGATILNGARIGSNCLIGAGALITENKVIPDGSLVMGAPGKIVRELDANAVEALKRSADVYVLNARRFAAGLSSR